MPLLTGRSYLMIAQGCALLLCASACAPATNLQTATSGVTSPAATSARPTETLAPGKIRRTLIDKTLASVAGWETRLYLVEYGPGAVAQLHIHPAAGVGYVLEGGFESAFGDAAATVVSKGQSFVDPVGVPHRVFRNLSTEEPLRFVIAYTIRSGDEQFYPGTALPAIR